MQFDGRELSGAADQGLRVESATPRAAGTETTADEELRALLEACHEHRVLRLAKDLIASNTEIARIRQEWQTHHMSRRWEYGLLPLPHADDARRARTSEVCRMSKRDARKRPHRPAQTPPSTSPGRPKESGSRQQAHPEQDSQSGSHELDSRAAHRRAPSVPIKPPGAK